MAGRTPTLFVTGISGLVGRSLLERLAPRRVDDGKGRRPDRILGLSRNVTAVAEKNVELVRGDLTAPSKWEAKLEGVDVVVHVGASTGKVREAEHMRVNVDGTRNLIEAAKRAGVPRFLFVSTIAATFPELKRYPYGRSKVRAEELVRESGLEWSILRPTIVLGKRAPAWHGLVGLARLPVMPVFGPGTARVQPVVVDDLAHAIAEWIHDDSLLGMDLDLGGPDTLTFEDLLRRVRARLKGKQGPVVHLPAGLMIEVLAALEGPLLPVLPLSAGQIYAFVHDGVAQPNPLAERLAPGMKGIDDVIAELAGV
jgi:NADH dehydrogenase